MSRARSIRITLMAALGALTVATTATPAGTFSHRKAITLSGVVGGPHAGFPVLISLVDADLKAGVVSPAGDDIVFRAEDPATCGGLPACTLDHEIEQWDGATGTLVAWVRLPALSAGTVIYMYYGNAAITSSTEARAAVWDAGYVGVWHLDEPHNAAVNGYRDSSRYANHGRGGKGTLAAAPSQVAGGIIGAAQHFDAADGTYDFIDGGDDGTLHVAGNQITLEAWVRHDITINAAHGTPPATSNPYGILNHKGWNDGYSLLLQGDSAYCPGGSAEPCLIFNLPGSTDSLATPQTAPLGPNTWHHVVATYDGTTMRVFVDGLNEGTRAKTGNVAPSTADQSMWIGQGDQPENKAWSAQYEGDLDEVRISQVARSPQWVATEYANESSPGAFYAVGTQQAGSYTVPTLTVNRRSIGTAGTLYTVGTATVAAGATTVSFGGGASLPAGVGPGDALTLAGPPLETLYVLSRDSATQVSLQTPAAAAHAGSAYTVARAFPSLAAWEGAREGDLVAERRREVGIAYDDGHLAGGVSISGSVTDPVHSITLTAAPGHRHHGRAGTGVVVDNGSSGSPAIEIRDDYVTVEWLEIEGNTVASADGIDLAGAFAPANRSTIRHNLVHDFGGDGIRVGDANTVADVYGNVVYETEYGVHLPVDLTPAARVNVFSNTIYGSNAAAGPSGVRSDVRQTSVRVDLRDNIAHSNAGGDFGVGPFFERGYFCDSGCQQIANGGVIGSTEYLADRGNDYTLPFQNVGTSCLYLGSAWPFRGVNVALATLGVSSGAVLQWDYWNGTAWSSLGTGAFTDGTSGFQWTGAIFWPNDPPGWTPNPVSGGPSLYYVRGCLAAGAYTTFPTESQITRVDVSLSSRNNLAGDITGRAHSALWAGSTGLDSVPLAAVAFVNTGTGTEDLHITAGSAAEDKAVDLGRRFSADIDGALRVDPWDIGADEASVATGPDLAITKDDGLATAVPGDPVTYTITVTNNGPGPLTSATVLEAVPPGIRAPVFTPSTGVYDPGTGIWTGLDLGAGLSATLTLQGTIAPSALGTLVNTVRVDPPSGVIDPDLSTNVASDVDALTASADLALTKTDDVDPVDIGGLLTYTLTVTNNGPSDATSVVLTDPLIPEMDFDSATSSQGSCSYDVPTRVVSCALGPLAAASGATVTVTVRPMELGTFVNSASVSGSEPDPTSANDSASASTTVQLSGGTGVRFFTVTSTSEQDVLEWLNPSADYVSTEIVFRTDRFPTAPGEPGSTTLYDAGTAGTKDSLVHNTGVGSNGRTYYYGAFVHRSTSPLLSAGRFCSGRPFDTSGPVKWAFSTGVFSIAAPTVTTTAVVAPSNDQALYAMQRGPLGGQWPAGWLPAPLGGPVQARSPVVPISVNGSSPVVFLGAQDGAVYAVDGTLGGAVAFPWPPAPVAATAVQAAPAGIFTAFGGAYDYLLVGTRDDLADNALVALDPATGAEIARFTNGGGVNGIGIIGGMASVDYASRRVYFASHAKSGGTASTLWCLQLGPSSPGPVFTLLWARALGDIDGSPVLSNGRVYVGSPLGGGTVYSIDADTGNPLLDRTFLHGDGQVKSFVFPDRSSADIYFATDHFVWGVSDTADPMADKFAGGVSLAPGVTPSPVLFVPGSHYVYVGGSDGRLYELDVLVSPPPVKWQVLGDGRAEVGAPSLDWPNGLVHVGSEAGVFYAVESPLAWGAAMCTNSCPGQPNGTPCSCVFADPCSDICISGACSDGGGC